MQENEEENDSEEASTNERHSERENTEEPSETESKPKPKEERKLTEEERKKLAEEKRKADQKKLAAWREARLNAIRSACPNASEEFVDAIDKLMRLQYLPEERKKVLEELAKSLGYEVKFVGADQLVENGTININGKVITIAMDSEHAVTETFGHELTHAIRAVSAEQYKKLLKTAKSMMKSESKWNHALVAYAERYKDLKTADEVEEELVADVIGQLVNSKNFVESFMPHADEETRSVLRDYINRFATALKGALSKVGIKVKEGEKPQAKNEIENKLDEVQKAVRDAIIGAQSANKENSQNSAESNGISSVTDAAEAALAQDGEGRSSMRTEQMDGEVKRSERIVTPEIDQAYMDAVGRGDMETAQRMVNEAAEKAGYKMGSDYQGTSAYNGAAPWGNGVFLTREERKEAWDNGEFEGEQTLGDYISDGIDGGNLETLTNDASMRAADKMRKEAIQNVRNAIQHKSKTIKMYRSVPASVKENSFRNGDWITPSRDYAKDNAALHGWGENYRIIEQEVPVDEVWFDGNDIAEWGYGRENDYINDTDYAYKNTENNRKSIDAVAYDDNGNVIPLSKRFNTRKSDVRYSKREAWKNPATMSDEEKAARGKQLMNAPAINVSSNQIVKTKDKSARVVAEEWWKDNVGDEPLHYNTEIGNVDIDIHSVKDSLAHRYGQVKLDAITSLREGFNNAVYLGTLNGIRKNVGEKTKYNHYFAYPISYEGKKNYVFCRVLEDDNKNRLYVHEVFIADNIQNGGNVLQTVAREPRGNIASYKAILANVLNAANVANNSDTRQESAEENGNRESKRSLVGVHNITEEKLAKALKLGGLANPSVAVIDSDKQLHNGFGTISLILPSDMVAKRTGRNAGTFFGDAWTPRFPNISKVINSKGYNKIADDASKLPDAAMAEEMRRAFVADYLEDGRSGGLEYWFLHDRGMNPDVVKKQGSMSKADVEAVRKATDVFYAKPKNLTKEQIEVLRDVASHYDGKTREYWAKEREKCLDFANDEGSKGKVRDFWQKRADQIEHYGMPEREVTNLIQEAIWEAQSNGDTDVEATRMHAAQYVRDNGLEGDFNDWLEGKERQYDVKDKLFQGYTYSGNRRYKDATLENISREMKKQGLNGAEGHGFSFNNFCASVMEKTGSLSEIRKRKDRLTSEHADIDAFTERWGKVYSTLAEALNPNPKGMFDDAGYSRLSEVALQSDPKAYAKRLYGVDLTEQNVKDIHDLVNAIRTERPSMYFETKFERPVMLNEFASAVVPTDVSDKIRKGLEDAGLKLHEYDRNKEGDRERAFNEAINERDDVKFSKRTNQSAERALRDALVGRLRESGIGVSLSEEEGQMVLDLVNGVARLNAAHRKSREAEARDRALRAIDSAMSVFTGRTPKEEQQLRRERERKFKEETKELYERVLAGNFDAVTLQQIDDFINRITPNNPYARPLSKRLPQRVGQKVSEGERTSRIDALFSRISESSVPANERTRPEAKRRIEEKKKELLKGWAIASGNWHTDVRDFVDDTKPIGSGKDSEVYHSKDGKSVIKVSKGKDNLKRFRPDMDNVALFNYVFPNSKYQILGYGEIDGKFVRFLRQPIVDFTGSTPLSVEERVSYMERLGFRPMNDEKTAFTNGTIVASDIQGNNIVKDKDGNVRVIDADMRLHTKDVGGEYSYPEVETDTAIPNQSSPSRTPNGTVREMRVYHGSGADFDAFDHSHMGEGEGAQAYGWGSYVTEVKASEGVTLNQTRVTNL